MPDVFVDPNPSVPEIPSSAPSAPVADGKPADAAESADTPPADTAPADETKADGKPDASAQPERTFTQKELDDILQKRLAKESRRGERVGYERARAELLQQENERLRNPQGANAKSEPSTGKPDPSQFKTYDEFAEALARFTARQEWEAIQKAQNEERERGEQERRLSDVRAKFAPAASKFEDFADVALSDSLPITPPMAAALIESDIPGEIAYWLGSNPKEAERIAALPPTRQVVEIAKIEERIKAPPKPTAAPAPIKPVGNQASKSKDIYDPNLSYGDFVKMRREQLKRA